MATRTINATTDLTYEEIYEGHANGKSRLPKVLKDIGEGSDPWATLAGTTGVNVLRRRTGGGNSTDVSGIGISVADPVAVLISAARYNALLSGYNGPDPYDTPPSQNFIDSDVRGVTKNPFDLIDFVSGIDNADQLLGSGDALATRAAKLKEQGSNSVIRNFTQIITTDTQSYDVRALNNDRIGSGGATGEVHGVNLGIEELIAAESEAVVGGTAEDASFDFTADPELAAQIDNTGGGTAEFGSDTLPLNAVLAEMNQNFKPGSGRDVAVVQDGLVTLRSQALGGEVDITDANTVLGFTVQTVAGATVGSAAIAATGQEIIDLDAAAVGALTNIRYGTYQFGTLRVYNSINDTDPVAYFMHPDLLSDLVAWNP